MGIFSFLTGCFQKKPARISKTEIKPIPLPKDAHLTRLYAHREGSLMEPYYILCKNKNGIYIKRTYDNPCNDERADALQENERYFYGVETVLKGERNAKSIRLSDENLIRKTEAILEKYGALGWSGWKKEIRLPAGVMDGDYYVHIYMELSNGECVEMSGSNISPAGYDSFHFELEKIFAETMDSLHGDAENHIHEA